MLGVSYEGHGFPYGPCQGSLADGFEKIAEAVVVEGFEGVVLVGGGEDDGNVVGGVGESLEHETVSQADVGYYEVDVLMVREERLA